MPEALCTSREMDSTVLAFEGRATFSDSLTPIREELTSRQTRNSTMLTLPKCETVI